MKNLFKISLMTLMILVMAKTGIGQDNRGSFHSIEEALKSPEKLTELHLYESYHDKTLPSAIGLFVNMEILNLLGNSIETLPPEIGQLKKLRILIINETNLNKLPPEIGQLTSLENLNLSLNKLKSLPPEIGKLENLKKIFIAEGITKVPDEIKNCKNLVEINLFGTDLTEKECDKLREFFPDVEILMLPHLAPGEGK